jgi:CheY-like chemotaxis protein
MLVDDDEDDREIFLSVVQNIIPEATFTIATNGTDALAKLNTGPVDPHLIFLDLNMPLMNGKEFLVARRKSRRINSIPTIILSTSSDKTTIKETLDLGARFFVTKPDKYAAWEDVLRNILMTFYNKN